MTRKRKQMCNSKANNEGTLRNVRRHEERSRSNHERNLSSRNSDRRSFAKSRFRGQGSKVSLVRRKYSPNRASACSRDFSRLASRRCKRKLSSDKFPNFPAVPTKIPRHPKQKSAHPHTEENSRVITIPGFQALLEGFDKKINIDQACEHKNENKVANNRYHKNNEDAVRSALEQEEQKENERVNIGKRYKSHNKSKAVITNTKSQPFECQKQSETVRAFAKIADDKTYNKYKDAVVLAGDKPVAKNSTQRQRLKLLTDEQIRELASQYVTWKLCPIEI